MGPCETRRRRRVWVAQEAMEGCGVAPTDVTFRLAIAACARSPRA